VEFPYEIQIGLELIQSSGSLGGTPAFGGEVSLEVFLECREGRSDESWKVLLPICRDPYGKRTWPSSSRRVKSAQ